MVKSRPSKLLLFPRTMQVLNRGLKPSRLEIQSSRSIDPQGGWMYGSCILQSILLTLKWLVIFWHKEVLGLKCVQIISRHFTKTPWKTNIELVLWVLMAWGFSNKALAATMLTNNQLCLHQTVAQIWVNIGPGNALLPVGTKPLPEPRFTYQWGPVAFIWGQFYKRYLIRQSLISTWKLLV